MNKVRNSYTYRNPSGYYVAHKRDLPVKRGKVHMIAKEVIRICIFCRIKIFAPFCGLLWKTIFTVDELKAFAVYIVGEICGEWIPYISEEVQKELNRSDINLFLSIAALFDPFTTLDIIIEFIQTKRPDFTNLSYFGEKVQGLISSLFNCCADDLSDQDLMILNWIDSDINDSDINDSFIPYSEDPDIYSPFMFWEFESREENFLW